MKGNFAYISAKGKLQRVEESGNIPSDAKEIVEFHVEAPPPPHTEEDHLMLISIQNEFYRVYDMIYKPPEEECRQL